MDQPYVYIFALVVAALVIFLGYYMINSLLNLGKQVETKKFENDLRTEVKSIYDFTPGTNSHYKSSVPSGIKGVCFVNVINADVDSIIYDDAKELVSVLKSGGTDKNLFYSVSGRFKLPDPIKIDKLKVKNDVLCKSTSRGILEIDLENIGNYVEVS